MDKVFYFPLEAYYQKLEMNNHRGYTFRTRKDTKDNTVFPNEFYNSQNFLTFFLMCKCENM